MNGVCVRFYTYEFQKHHGMMMYEWLLEFAKKQGLHGGSAFRGIAGFGRQGVIHEEKFFELASDVPVEVVLIAKSEDMAAFIDLLKEEKIDLFYVKIAAEFNFLQNNN